MFNSCTIMYADCFIVVVLRQPTAAQEVGASTEELPLYVWPVFMSVRKCLDGQLMWECLVHCR